MDEFRKATRVYQMTSDRSEMWRAWLTLNDIPTANVVRDRQVKIDEEDDIDPRVGVVVFETDQNGNRIKHHCSCSYGTGRRGGNEEHVAKLIKWYPLVEFPGDWAEQDLVRNVA